MYSSDTLYNADTKCDGLNGINASHEAKEEEEEESTFFVRGANSDGWKGSVVFWAD